jgi:hypothetical protein
MAESPEVYEWPAAQIIHQEDKASIQIQILLSISNVKLKTIWYD